MYKNILVPVDLDDHRVYENALETAAALAKCFSSRITICSVVRSSDALVAGDWLPISFEQLLLEARMKLDSIRAQLDGGLAVEIEVGTGTICAGVLDVASRTSSDLIVLASHRPGVVDYVRAANGARIARRATCSVMVVRTHPLARGAQQHEEVVGA